MDSTPRRSLTMLFNSPEFLAFLPIVFGLYWFATHRHLRAQNLLLVNPPQLCEEVFEKPEIVEGLPWIEGNDWPLAKVDTLYYDDHHLRGVGAELYSEWLAGQVESLFDKADSGGR